MKNYMRLIRNALIILCLSLPAFAQDEHEPLEENEGYLVVAISMTGFAYKSVSIDDNGSFFFAHDFMIRDLKPGLNYKIVKLRAGTYFWKKMLLDNLSYFFFDKTDFPLTVKAGHINYAGSFIGEAIGGKDASFVVVNNATEAIAFIEKCCEHLLDNHPVRYSVTGDDPFLEYYFSLPKKSVSEEAEANSEDTK